MRPPPPSRARDRRDMLPEAAPPFNGEAGKARPRFRCYLRVEVSVAGFSMDTPAPQRGRLRPLLPQSANRKQVLRLGPKVSTKVGTVKL